MLAGTRTGRPTPTAGCSIEPTWLPIPRPKRSNERYQYHAGEDGDTVGTPGFSLKISQASSASARGRATTGSNCLAAVL
jgi:hypothetical protein